MNFEYQIEQELKRIFEADSRVVAGAYGVLLSGEIKQDLAKTRIINMCVPRENLNGPLWDVETTIAGVTANAIDETGATLQTVYSIIADIVDSIKKDPSQLNATIGTSTGALTATETITELPVTLITNAEVTDNLPTTGTVKLVNSAGSSESVSYSAFDVETGIFTVSHLLVNSYAAGDSVKDLNIYCVDGLVNQQKSSTPLQLGEIRAFRSLTVLLKVSYTP